MTASTAIAACVLAAAIGCALVGGLFFAFSSFIMRAFDRLPAAQAIAAMQSINVTVINPLFFVVFFGTAVIAVGLAATAALRWQDPASGLVVFGAAAYLVGTILVTLRFNVPLNNRLADIQPADDGSADAWRRYRLPWTRWNHVRTVASLLAALSFGIALQA